MNDTSGFYRIDANNDFQFAPNFVYAPTYELKREYKDTYSYPTEGGWRWFDDAPTACSYYNINYETFYSSSLMPPEQSFVQPIF